MILLAAPALNTRLNRTRSEASRPAATVRPDVDAATRSWSHAGHRRAALTRHSRYALPAGHPRTVAHGAEKEQPLVVVRTRSLVDLERRFFALAPNAHHSTDASLTTERWSWRACGGGSQARRWSTQAARRRTTAPTSTRLLRRSAALTRDAAGGIDDVPFATLVHRQRRVVLGHRILVFLSKKPALNQDVETRWVACPSHLSHIEVDAPGDLFTAENEFRFLLALRLRFPDGHRDRHEHHHHGETDEQRRHRVTALVGLTTL
jgi:hypothetical protein